MNRTLVLMRHAAAEGWSAEGDKGRRLSSEGRRQAEQAGAELRGLGIAHVLCSSATRTRETLACLGLDVPVEYMDALYDCGTETLLQRIGEVPDEVASLLVVGHSPAIPSLSAELAWSASPEQADDIRCWFPTAAFSRFTLDDPWSALASAPQLRLAGVTRIGH